MPVPVAKPGLDEPFLPPALLIWLLFLFTNPIKD